MRIHQTKAMLPKTSREQAAYIIAVYLPFLAATASFLWFKSDSADTWEKIADAGSWAVIIGVAAEFPELILKLIEGSLKKWPQFENWFQSRSCLKRAHNGLKKWEVVIDSVAFVAWLVIVVGLVIELGANQRARIIQDAEFSEVVSNAANTQLVATNLAIKVEELRSNNLVLAKVGDDARKSASDAAADAERAKIERVAAEKEVEEFKGKNLALQLKVLELEKGLQPRSITKEQHDNFVALSASIPKQPVWIAIQSSAQESSFFAQNIRKMMNDAGFGGDFGSLPPVAGSFGSDGIVAAFGLTVDNSGSATVLLAINRDETKTLQNTNIAVQLLNAFNAAGIEVARINSDAPPGHPFLVILTKHGL
jgi:hypothetical protein